MSFTSTEVDLISACLEGGLFGIYSGIFAIHLALHATKRGTHTSITFYALCVLYVLTGAVFVFSISLVGNNVKAIYGIIVGGTAVFGCSDFIAQSILIHRCWIVYDRNTRVIIVPSILACAFLVMWVSTDGGEFIIQNEVQEDIWANKLLLASLITSMTVNALVTGLIVFKILKVFRGVKSVSTLEDKSFGPGGNKLRSVIFIIIESGMALFVSQLARVIITPLLTSGTESAEIYAFQFIGVIHEMVNGIAPTVILVRVSLGLSFHDEKSLDDAVGSLKFAATQVGSTDEDSWSSHSEHVDDLNPLPVMENVNQEGKDDEIQVGGSDDVDR